MESLYVELAQEILGFPGKIIGASKSGYRENFPDHLVVFNSNVFVEKNKISNKKHHVIYSRANPVSF